jgi:hypothetical protein
MTGFPHFFHREQDQNKYIRPGFDTGDFCAFFVAKHIFFSNRLTNGAPAGSRPGEL